jgi:hypothetical protein
MKNHLPYRTTDMMQKLTDKKYYLYTHGPPKKEGTIFSLRKLMKLSTL